MPKEKPKEAYPLQTGLDDEGKLVSWNHPGGKLFKLGAKALTDQEVLALLLGSGSRGVSAMDIAKTILKEFSTFRGMVGYEYDSLRNIKGLNDAKIARLGASFEFAQRLYKQVTTAKMHT